MDQGEQRKQNDRKPKGQTMGTSAGHVAHTLVPDAGRQETHVILISDRRNLHEPATASSFVWPSVAVSADVVPEANV
jgi:hypothetical protein